MSSRRSWSSPARWPSRDNSHDASRCGSASRLSAAASPRLSAPFPQSHHRRSQAHEALGTMTTIIMRPLTIIACGRFWLYSKVFNFWETCRLRSFSTRHLQAPKNNPGTFHHPAGAQRLRRPARKSAIPPCGFMMFRMGGAQKHSPGSMSPWHPNPSRIPQAHCRQPRSACF